MKKKKKHPRCILCGRFLKKVNEIIANEYVEWKCVKAYYSVTGNADDGWEHE
jgi:ribosomal protein L34E